jgi:hypothetical protein
MDHCCNHSQDLSELSTAQSPETWKADRAGMDPAGKAGHQESRWHTHIYTCTIYIHIYVYIYTYMHINTYQDAYIHTIYIIHTHTNIHAYRYTHTYIHVLHTHILTQSSHVSPAHSSWGLTRPGSGSLPCFSTIRLPYSWWWWPVLKWSTACITGCEGQHRWRWSLEDHRASSL